MRVHRAAILGADVGVILMATAALVYDGGASHSMVGVVVMAWLSIILRMDGRRAA